MKYLFYDLLVHFALVVLSPYFLVRMVFSGKYRSGLVERFGFVGKKARELNSAVRDSGGAIIWFHAVSVGEARAGLTLVKRLKEARPDVKVLFSTVTPTGQAVVEREGKEIVDALIYFPLDLSWVVSGVVKSFAPKLFVIVEKEYWPNMIRRCFDSSIPVAVVNGTISKNSFRLYKKYSFLFKDIFAMVTLFCARTAEDADRAQSIGVASGGVTVTGNLKFDMGLTDGGGREAVDWLRDKLDLGEGERVIVAGSTHPGEEEIVLDAFRAVREKGIEAKLLIAPRHPERFASVAALIEKKGFKLSKRSEPIKDGGVEVILLDTLGELFTAYGLAYVSFVGGSLVDIGGHNLLEPAYYGSPVLYGPHTETCADMAVMVEDKGAGRRVADGTELADALSEFLKAPKLREEIGSKAKELVTECSGTTATTLDQLLRLFIEGKGGK